MAKMNAFYLYLLFWMLQIICAEDTYPRRDLLFLDLAKYDGYEAEQHFVTTEDGYILSLFRIPPSSNCSASKGTIMFMHGLYLSSDDCLIPGPGKAHCYIYSDNCYDVWAPNIRGNVYSRNHTKYDPDKDASFWDFAIDEMAMYDLPASIDYVLNTTGHTQLSYVGHSQGAALLLVLCAKIPEYNDKIKVGIGLSVTAWMEHSRFVVVYIQGILERLLTLASGLFSIELLPRNGIVNNITTTLCGVMNSTYPLCSNLLFAALGYNEYQITSDVFPVVAGHVPCGTSLKNFNRWGQMKNNGFSEYDYGMLKNLFVYGRLNPPLFNLTNVSMKWIILGSSNDYLGDLEDLQQLLSNLPNGSLCVLSDETFGHLDFVYGKDVPNFITSVVLSYLETGNYTCP